MEEAFKEGAHRDYQELLEVQHKDCDADTVSVCTPPSPRLSACDPFESSRHLDEEPKRGKSTGSIANRAGPQSEGNVRGHVSSSPWKNPFLDAAIVSAARQAFNAKPNYSDWELAFTE